MMIDSEFHFKAVCVVLASLIIIILTKLLYDYWQYRFLLLISRIILTFPISM